MDFDLEELNLDFTDMATLIADTLALKEVDYCYSSKILRQVINKCNERHIDMVYERYDDKYGDFDYFKLYPVIFLNAETLVPFFNTNMQIDIKDLPKGYACKLGRYYYGIGDSPVPDVMVQTNLKKARKGKHI